MLTLFIWNRTPAEWLCDYCPNSIELEQAKADMKLHFPKCTGTAMTLLFFALLHTTVHLSACNIASIFILGQISLADCKFRIIPDQWLVLLAFINLWRLM